MATTFALELSNKPNKRGAYAIYLRITQNRKLKRIKTSIEVKRASDFNKATKNEKWVRPSEPNHAIWNEALSDEIEKAKKKYRELKEGGLATSEKIISEIKAGEKSASFLEYARRHTQEVYDAGGFRNWKKYNGFCNKLTAYLKKHRAKDITFAEITPAMLSKFERFLSTLPNEREPDKRLHPNTIELQFIAFKALIKRAIEVEGLMALDKNPFIKYQYKGVETTKEKLDINEINRLIELDLEVDSMLWHCRNYFLFSFYCAGIRAGDFVQLRWCNIEDNNRVAYQMGKNHKVRDLILIPQAKEILSHYYNADVKPTDYIFPLLDSSDVYAQAVTQKDRDTLSPDLKKRLFNQVASKNALINKYLKKLAEMAGINKKISFHIARHSFAKVAKLKNTDSSKVQKILGHSNIKVTEVYMGSFETNEYDKTLKGIFDVKEAETSTPDTTTQREELLSLLGGLDATQIEGLLNQIKQKQ